MKKIIAMLLALCMALSCASVLAEETAVTKLTGDQTLDMGDFGITFTVPEGWYMADYSTDNVVILQMEREDGTNQAHYVLSIAYDEAVEGKSLEDISDEELAETWESFAAAYEDPEMNILETAYGTKLIEICEKDAASGYATIYTLYKGFDIEMAIWCEEEISDEELANAVQVLSDVWFTDAETPAEPTPEIIDETAVQ